MDLDLVLIHVSYFRNFFLKNYQYLDKQTCCCKYLHNHTSCPPRQASSDRPRARLTRSFVGEGKSIQRHTNAAYLRLPLSGTDGVSSESICLMQAKKKNDIMYVQFMCNTCHLVPAALKYFSVSVVPPGPVFKIAFIPYHTFESNNSSFYGSKLK